MRARIVVRLRPGILDPQGTTIQRALEGLGFPEVRDLRVCILVSDMGTGLPTELAGKLFDPFITTKENGMGIGLTIARTIVEAHGGSLHAMNNPAGGATFQVALPCLSPWVLATSAFSTPTT